MSTGYSSYSKSTERLIISQTNRRASLTLPETEPNISNIMRSSSIEIIIPKNVSINETFAPFAPKIRPRYEREINAITRVIVAGAGLGTVCCTLAAPCCSSNACLELLSQQFCAGLGTVWCSSCSSLSWCSSAF